MRERPLATVAAERGLIGGPFGSNLVGKDYVESGVPVIRGTNMLGRYIGGDFVFVSREKFGRDLARNNAIPGDLIFTQRGTLGQVAIVPEGPYEEYVISQSQMRLRVDDSVADPRFVYYACTRPEFIGQISNNAIATGVPHINLGILGRLTIPDMPRAGQSAIAQVLGALDDKIAANERAIAVADELSAARVEFARNGTELVRLGGLLRLNYGKALPATTRVEGEVTVYGSGGVVGTHDQALVDGSGIIVGRKGTVGAVYWADGPHYPIDTTYFAEAVSDVPDAVLYFLLRRMPLAELNSDSAVPGLNRDQAYAQTVRAPRGGVARRLGVELRVQLELITALRIENLRLARARDELLPLLMSGKVRVRDAEKVVEGMA